MFTFLPVKLDSLIANTTRLTAAVKAVQRDALQSAGEVIKKEWKDNILTTLTHGYATGNYYDSIEVTDVIPVETDFGELPGVEVGSTIEPEGGQPFSYPYYLEYGTANMDAYPTMTPAFEAKKDEAAEVAKAKIAAALALGFRGAALDIGITTMEAKYGGKTASQLGRG